MSEQTQEERLKALGDRLDAVKARSGKTDARARELIARLKDMAVAEPTDPERMTLRVVLVFNVDGTPAQSVCRSRATCRCPDLSRGHNWCCNWTPANS